MRYEKQFVKRVVSTVIKRKCSAREAERLLCVPRKTIARWVKRKLSKLPFWFSKRAKTISNRTSEKVLSKMKALLKKGTSAVLTWIKLKKRIVLRTVQRWKAKWFPQVKIKKKVRRYQRRKIGSLMHTDWASKRIKNGKRMVFTFYIDDATRRLYALRAYKKANQENTFNALANARKREA